MLSCWHLWCCRWSHWACCWELVFSSASSPCCCRWSVARRCVVLEAVARLRMRCQTMRLLNTSLTLCSRDLKHLLEALFHPQAPSPTQVSETADVQVRDGKSSNQWYYFSKTERDLPPEYSEREPNRESPTLTPQSQTPKPTEPQARRDSPNRTTNV